jgi:hypothetical protein
MTDPAPSRAISGPGEASVTRAGAARPVPRHQVWYRVLYIQVLAAIGLGVVVGYFFPHTGTALRSLGDGFIALIKMMIAPVIFCTVVHGIGAMGDLKKVGRSRAWASSASGSAARSTPPGASSSASSA